MTGPDLSQCKLFIATPIYDGAQGSYVRAALVLASAAQQAGIGVRFEFILYQPQIHRARSMLASQFLNSDCTHLLFIDADIDFAAQDIFSMVSAMEGHDQCSVLGAPVPKRNVHWGQVARAAERGLARDNPADLARYAGDFAFDFLHPNQRFNLAEMVELSQLGTGLMLIRRRVIEDLVAVHPELAFRADADEQRAYRVGETVHALFLPMIEGATRRLLSEDYSFCLRVRAAGHRIWLAPWVRTSHSGPAQFNGSLADLVPLFSSSPDSSPE